MYLSRKYQVGGIAYTPYLSAPPGSAQESINAPSGGTSKSSSPEKISGTIKKEIIDLLKENGIPSDVSTFLNAANGFLQKSQSLSGMSLFGGTNDDYDLTDLIKIQQMVTDVKYNNALKDAATKQLTEEMAGSEVAVTDNGHIYAQDKDGNITTVSPETYAKNKDSYTPLTNNQLLYLREHDNGLSFQTGILNDLRNTVGMKSITDYLKGQITSFGKDEKGGYATKDNPVVRGMEVLMAAGPDGYYKFKDENQLRDVNAAIKYLYNGLSPNAKNLLKAKTAADGGDPTNMTDVCDLILQALTIFPDRSQTVDFDKTATEFAISSSSGSGNGSDPKNLKEYNYVERLAAGQNSGLPEPLKITHRGATVDMNILAWNVGNIIKDKEENELGSGMLDSIRQDAYGLNQAANQSTVQFGDQEFDKNSQSTIFYDNTPMYRTKMPATRNDKGEIVVDWKAVELVNNINESIKGKEYTPDMLERLLKETDPRLYIDSNGNIAWSEDAWFLTFEGIVANNYENNLNTDSPYLQKVSPSEEARLKEKYETANKYGYTNPSKNSLERVGRNRKQGHFIIDWRNHDLYRSKVFMPITRQLAGSAEFYPAATHMDNMNTALARQRQVQIQKELDMGIRKTNF